MPITPKANRTMFEEIAEDQPGLVLPTEDQIISGYAGMRARARGLGVARDVGSDANRMVRRRARRSRPVYLYRFDWATPVFKIIRTGRSPATELIYTWGNLVSGSRDFTFKLGGLKQRKPVRADPRALDEFRPRCRPERSTRGTELDPTAPGSERPWCSTAGTT